MKRSWLIFFIAIGILFLGLLSFVIVILSNLSKKSGDKKGNAETTTIVVSHYKENIDWTNLLKPYFRIVIMEKHCKSENCSPNVANEATSYLKYILTNYEKLPSMIGFVHGDNQSWHHKGLLSDILPVFANIAKGQDYLSLNSYVIRDHQNYIDMPDFQHFYNDIFKEYFGTIENYKVYCEERKDRKACAQFFVKRETIHRLPKSFYQTYYDWLIRHSTRSHDPKKDYSTWKTGRFAEHVWDFLFMGELKKFRIIQIVVARYKENVMWTAPFAHNVTIVNKGPTLPLPLPTPVPIVTSTPNVGREGHTYYSYICDHYNHLPEHIVFLQGNPFDHSPNIVEMLQRLIAHPSHRATLDFAFLSEKILLCRLSGDNYHKGLPLARVYSTLFGYEGPQELEFYFGTGAQFVVSRRRILQRPKAFYKRIVACWSIQ